jgi:hypothetical protein
MRHQAGHRLEFQFHLVQGPFGACGLPTTQMESDGIKYHGLVYMLARTQVRRPVGYTLVCVGAVETVLRVRRGNMRATGCRSPDGLVTSRCPWNRIELAHLILQPLPPISTASPVKPLPFDQIPKPSPISRTQNSSTTPPPHRLPPQQLGNPPQPGRRGGPGFRMLRGALAHVEPLLARRTTRREVRTPVTERCSRALGAALDRARKVAGL